MCMRQKIRNRAAKRAREVILLHDIAFSESSESVCGNYWI
jgi:hypothetical protein